MKKSLLCLLLAATLLAGGCVSSVPGGERRADVPLPTVRPVPDAPIGDTQTAREVSAVIYLPDADGTQLSAEVRRLTVGSGESEHEVIVRELLSAISESGFSGGQELKLANMSFPVEVTGELATVYLNASARVLGIEALYALRMAITNTLTEMPGINYVNTLINGWDTGLDVAMTMPVGVMARYPSGDVNAFWSQIETQLAAQQGELQKAAALYFLSADGRAMLAEVRNITFDTRELNHYGQKLLEELANGAMNLSAARTVVPPADYFERNIEVNDSEGSGRVAVVYLREEVDDYLLLRESTRGQMMMTICYTLTGFLPRLDGVVFNIGGSVVRSAVLPDGTQWQHEDGMLRRSDLNSFAADVVNVYYPLEDGSGLRAVQRPVEQRFRSSPRALMRELMKAPDEEGITAALPQGVSDADVIGIRISGDTALMNLTANFAALCAGMNAVQERNMIYSIVNTMTEMTDVARVRLYVEGEQTQLAGHLFLPGEFLRSSGLIVQ